MLPRKHLQTPPTHRTEGDGSTLTPPADHWLKTVTRNTRCYRRAKWEVKHLTYIPKLAGTMSGEDAQRSLGNVVTHTEEWKTTTNADHATDCHLTDVSSLNLGICGRWEAEH